MKRVVIGSVIVRIVAAVVLIAGPWTNEATELDGWDVARFEQIATAEGRPYVDHEVEYPPGSVVAIEAIVAGSVVKTHRVLVALSLAIDLGVAAMLAALAGNRVAGTYLLLGLPLVPMGLVRFDLWAVALAMLAVVALRQRKPGAFAALTVAATLVKVWPALLVAAAFATGRYRAALASVGLLIVAGLGWLAYGGWSLDPLDQVLSLRGATGWHVESVGGTLTALFTDQAPTRQLDAYRIGDLDDRLVLTGRALAVAAIAALSLLVARRLESGDVSREAERQASPSAPPHLVSVALVMLGSTAALIVTAPLLSPQFLLWLTPWAALLMGGDEPRRYIGPVALTGLATATTGFVLARFGPPNLAERTPALLLAGRNVVLVAIVVAAMVAAGSSGRAEDPLRQRGAGPRPARSEP